MQEVWRKNPDELPSREEKSWCDHLRWMQENLSQTKVKLFPQNTQTPEMGMPKHWIVRYPLFLQMGR